MLYDHRSLGGSVDLARGSVDLARGSADSASARAEPPLSGRLFGGHPPEGLFRGRRSARWSTLRRTRTLSVWGLGAALGLLSFPLRAWSGEPESVAASSEPESVSGDPDPVELAGELCPVSPGDGSLDLAPESCDLPAAAAPSSSREPALLTVLGGDARLADLVDPAGFPEDLEDLILLPQAPWITADGFFGISWPVVALAGGGTLFVLVVLTSGGGGGGGGGTNMAPTTTTLAPAMLEAVEEAAADWDASAWFTDPDPGDTLTYAGTLQKADAMTATALSEIDWLGLDAMTGALTIAAGATDDADVGTYTLLVTATDAAAETATHTVTLTITDSAPAPGPGPAPAPSASNEAPTTTTLAPTSLTVDEGEAETWDVTDWFDDPDTGDTLTYAVSGNPQWLELDDTMGELTITEGITDDAEVAASPYTFTVTASDAAGETAVHTATLTVANVNKPPTLTDVAPTTTAPLTVDEGAAATWTLADWFDDPDAGDDTLFYAAMGFPDRDWLVFDAATSALTIAAAATDDIDVGSHVFTVTATDARALSAVHTVTLEVANVNEAPTLTDEAPTAMAPLTVKAGAAEAWTLADWFTDPDPGDTLTYTVLGNPVPVWLEFGAATNELTIAATATTGADIGPHVFTVTATDTGVLSTVHTVTLEVERNTTPVVVTTTIEPAPTTLTAMEGGTAQAFTLLTWFRDPDGDRLAFALGTESPSWATIDSTSGVSILNLAFDETDDIDVGTHTLAVTATDRDNESISHTVTITVLNVNDSPTTTTDAPTVSLAVAEGDAANWNVSAWFDDPDLAIPGDIDSLSYTGTLQKEGAATAVLLPAWLGLDEATGALTIAADATDDTEIGTYTLSVTAHDEANETAVHTATLEITDTANDPFFVGTVSNRIAPVMGMSLVLDIARAFSDFQEDGTETPPDELTFSVSSSIDDTSAENIITALRTGTVLTLTPGDASGPSGGLWNQETVSITATDNDGKTGVATFTVTTRANGLDTSTLAPAHGFIIQGDSVLNEAGRSVSGAGDINGDGLDDLIVGADWSFDNTFHPGEAYVVYGEAGLGDGSQFGTAVTTMGARRQVVDATSLVPADGFILYGDGNGEEFGYSVSAAGDVNGDGLDDLIVGSRFGNGGGPRFGEAYIVYGKVGDGTQFGTEVRIQVVKGVTTTIEEDGNPIPEDSVVRRILDMTHLAPTDGFIIQGYTGDDRLGASVSGAGDVNGDGLDDLIVGAHVGTRNHGETYIVYGKAGDGTQFGTAVRLASDGITTLSPEASDDDSVVRQVVDTKNLAPADGFIIEGELEKPLCGYVVGGPTGPVYRCGLGGGKDLFGWSVSGAGDINGDGLADLILGARQLILDNAFATGGAYVVYGKAGTDGSQFGTAVRRTADGMTLSIEASEGVVRQVLDTKNLAPADGFVLWGDTGFDRFGASVSGAGDINGDGLDDFIVGAHRGDDGDTGAGEAYIIYGKADTAAGDPGTQFGVRVAISQDGMTTTTLKDDDPVPENSVVRRVLDTSFLAPTDGFILQGNVGYDQLGISVSGAGDVNGDGLADLIAGAHIGYAGMAYIIYGKAGTDGMQFGSPDGSRQVLDTTGLAPTDGFVIHGDEPRDELGRSVSGAGDVNGDGFDDLIVGASQGDDGESNAGEAYVVYGGTHLGEVVSHAQTLTAAAGELFFRGGAGDDRLVGHADTEVLYGGAGDDVLVLADASFRRIDGGLGDDTLVLGMDVVLDLTEVANRGRVRGIEAVSLSDASSGVALDLVTVYALVGSRDNGGPHTDPGEAFLRLEGVSGATVMLTDAAAWTVEMTDAEGDADLYAQGAARLLIDDGLVATAA